MTKEPRTSHVLAAWDRDAAATILDAVAAVDDQDLEFLVSRLDDSGRGQFWKKVIADLRPAFQD